MTPKEIIALQKEIDRLRQENQFLKSGVDVVYKTISEEYPGLTQTDDYPSRIKNLGILFSSLESHKEALDQQLQALDSVGDGIAIFSGHGKLIFSNKSFGRIFGIKKDSLIDMHWREIFQGENESAVRAFLREVSLSFPIHQEVVLQRGDKRQFLNCSVYPLKNGNMLANIKDITTEKKKLFKMQEQALLLKSSGEFIGICYNNWKFSFLNASGRRLFDISADIFGFSFTSFLKNKKEFESQILPRIHDRKGWVGELEITTKQKRFPAYCEIIPFEQSEFSDGGYYIILQDITERKQAIKKLVQAKDVAERNMEIRQQFLANMSHEIRTPMHAIIGLTNLLLDSKLGKKQRDFADSIRLSAENLLVIINDILDISKIESGKLELEKVAFDFETLLDGVHRTFGFKIKEKGLVFKEDLPDELPKYLVGDPTRLNQILLNLISNAIKFTDQGEIVLSLDVLERNEGRVKLRFEIRDTGIGIAKENLSKIFHAFTQESSTTTRVYGGTGLGLAIVRQLVELQNGRIWVESRINKGSSFFFELSFGEANGVLASSKGFNKDFNDSKIKSARIVMAEDYPMNQLLAKSLFEKWDLNLKIVNNGKELLDLLEVETFDIILMDIQMPEMDGLEATRLIRKRGLKTPIVAITAHAFEEERTQCMKAGMNDFISKPFEEQELKEKLVTYLNLKTGDLESLSKFDPEEEEEDMVFGLGYIREMGAGDESFIEQMLSMMLDQVPQTLNSMIDALNKGDRQLMAKFAHTVQSSFVMVERFDMKTELKKLELWGKGIENLEDPFVLLTEILEKAKEILRGIADYLEVSFNTHFTNIEFNAEWDSLIDLKVDFKKIDELAENATDFRAEMLELYLTQTKNQLISINNLKGNKSWSEIKLIVHNMIGSFDLIGCVVLSQFAKTIEDKLESLEDKTQVLSDLEKFEKLTGETFELVREGVGK